METPKTYEQIAEDNRYTGLERTVYLLKYDLVNPTQWSATPTINEHFEFSSDSFLAKELEYALSINPLGEAWDIFYTKKIPVRVCAGVSFNPVPEPFYVPGNGVEVHLTTFVKASQVSDKEHFIGELLTNHKLDVAVSECARAVKQALRDAAAKRISAWRSLLDLQASLLED